MTKKKEEWQDPDSGYLNCIGVGDTYVKKQIARILSQNKLTADYVSWFAHKNGIEVYTGNVEFKKHAIDINPMESVKATISAENLTDVLQRMRE